MPLRTPVLDDRSYAQLRDELIARIPVYAPEWTDHHSSDPGITLLELFAFLGENLLYRFNQLPDATKMAFLDLLHIPLRAAVPAAGHVRFETKTAGGVVVSPATRVLAGDVGFQTDREVTVWPITAAAAIRQQVEAETLDADTDEYLQRSVDALGLRPDSVVSYRTAFGASKPLAPGGDVLDPTKSIDGSIYIGILSDTPDLTAMAGGRLTLGVIPATDAPLLQDWTDDDACPGTNFQPRTPPAEWQICTLEAVSDASGHPTDDPVWRTLTLEGDTTGGMTTPGVIELRLPTTLDDIGIFVPDDPEKVGAGDQPPLVEDPEIGARLVAWIRVFRPTGGDLDAIEFLDANIATVEQATSARAEYLGVGTGDADQQRRLVHGNVLGTVGLEVEEIGAGRWVPWTQVDDFRASGVDDRHFVVDPEAGIVSAGDGRRGRPWQIGERIRVSHYRYGGGAAGNVGPESITKAPDTAGVKVTNPLSVRGGADAEPLPDAVARIPQEFRRHDRAVTTSDFRELAEATPGAGVARAETLPLFDPVNRRTEVPGAISVVVFPEHDREHPGAPRPDRTMLDAVCRYLDARRLVTTELHVIPPTYRPIAVSVGISVKPGHGVEGVRRWVELVVRQFLAPLPPYGPEGRGWPLGRRVFAPDLEAAALQVEGVEFLQPTTASGTDCPVGLRLAEEVDGVWTERATRIVQLEDWEVPELAEITVVEGEALEPGASLDPRDPGDDGTGSAVPVRSPREVC